MFKIGDLIEETSRKYMGGYNFHKSRAIYKIVGFKTIKSTPCYGGKCCSEDVIVAKLVYHELETETKNYDTTRYLDPFGCELISTESLLKHINYEADRKIKRERQRVRDLQKAQLAKMGIDIEELKKIGITLTLPFDDK